LIEIDYFDLKIPGSNTEVILFGADKRKDSKNNQIKIEKLLFADCGLV
jgi:hypothetical protein